jgi:chemotaxis protein methyltransferase CheR
MIELGDETLLAFIRLIHQYAGITMDVSRSAMIRNRLRPRVGALKLETFEDYLKHLTSEANEVQVFVNLLTTNETYFFRTPRIWSYINHDFLSAWKTKNPGITFRAWSAASSSGEEAYSLGILLQEFREKNLGFQYQIFGTDISTEILQYAEKASYEGRSIENFQKNQPDLFAKYLKPRDGEFQVVDEIRSRVRFRRHNLFEPLAGGEKFDLVLIRNVLIYFIAVDQEKVLSNVRRSIQPDGTLIIGESESLSQLNTTFIFRQPLIYGAAA